MQQGAAQAVPQRAQGNEQALIRLIYDRGSQEYQALIDRKDWAKKAPFRSIRMACNAIPPVFGFKSKKKIDQESEKSVHQYWWTQDDGSVRDFILYLDNEGKGLAFIDPEVRKISNEVLERQVDSAAVELNYEKKWPRNSRGFVPRPYQEAGVMAINGIWTKSEREGIHMNPFLGDDMGLGKTAQALLAAHESDARNILIVCPSSLKYNWKNEIGIWLNTGESRFCEESSVHADGWRIKRDLVTILESGMKLVSRTSVWIINYDLLKTKKMLERVLARKWDLIIADEVQEVKNKSSQRSKAFYKLHAKKKLAMSGTLGDKVEDAWAVLSWLYPSRFGDRHRFRQNYITDRGGAARLGRDLRQTIMIARKKEQVAKELPPYVRSILPIEGDNATKKLIKRQASLFGMDNMDEISSRIKSLRNFELEINQRLEAAKTTDEKLALTNELRERFLSMSEALEAKPLPFESIAKARSELAEAKRDYAVKRLKEILAERKKIVVFYHHSCLGDAVEEAFGPWVVRVDGSVTGKHRQAAVDRFTHSAEARIFLGSIKACNSGLNLQVADWISFLERDWNASVNFQAEDRIHRIGQRYTCFSESMLFTGSIEERMYQLSAQKARIIGLVMNSAS